MEYREDLMAKAPSVRKNYIYNLIYQVMTLITPFITTPYISRVLGADGTGVQSYTNSVVQYFAILAALGTASYGQREIARHRDTQPAFLGDRGALYGNDRSMSYYLAVCDRLCQGIQALLCGIDDDTAGSCF